MKAEPLREFRIEKLNIKIYQTTEIASKAASDWVATQLYQSVITRAEANLILSMGTSQFAFLDALKKNNDIQWSEIRVFHLDEYLGLPIDHPSSLGRNLKERILDEVDPKEICLLSGQPENVQEELNNYAEKLKQHPPDVACIGIGENGHLAFNDPAVADFSDPEWVKVVELDEICRKQQVGEGWYTSLNEVPTRAQSLTIPAIMRSRSISCVVPEKRKAKAVYHALYGPVSSECPASILRTHDHATLFLDPDSAFEL